MSGFLFFFNETIKNSIEEQLASNWFISRSASQAPSIPRQTILWSKLQILLVFALDCNRSRFDTNKSLTIKLKRHNIKYIDNLDKYFRLSKSIFEQRKDAFN